MRQISLRAKRRERLQLGNGSQLLRWLTAEKPGGGIFSRLARTAHKWLLQPPAKPQERCECQASPRLAAASAGHVTQRDVAAAPDNTLLMDKTDSAESSSDELSDRTGSVIDITG